MIEKNADFGSWESLPSDIIFLIFIFLKKKDYKKLSMVNKKFHKAYYEFKETPYFQRQKIFKITSKLGLLISTQHLFGNLTKNELESLAKFAELYEANQQYVKGKKQNTDLNLLSIPFVSMMPDHPLVLLTKCKFYCGVALMRQGTNYLRSFVHLPNNRKLLIPTNTYQLVQKLKEQKRKSPHEFNTMKTHVEKLKGEADIKQYHLLLSFVDDLPNMSEIVAELSNKYNKGIQSVYFALIYIGLQFGTDNQYEYNEAHKVELNITSLLELPFFKDIFSVNEKQILAYEFIRKILVELNIHFPELNIVSKKSTTRRNKNCYQLNVNHLTDFLINLEWHIIYWYHPKNAVDTLSFLANYVNKNIHIELFKLTSNDFNGFYHLPWVNKVLHFYIQTKRDIRNNIDVLLSTTWGKKAFEKIEKSKNLNYIKKINTWLVNSQKVNIIACHPSVLEEAFERLKTENTTYIALPEQAYALLANTEKTCWSIDDFRSFFFVANYQDKTSIECQHDRFEFIKKLPEIITYWRMEEVITFFTSTQGVEVKAKLILEELSSNLKRTLILKKFKTYNDLLLLSEKIPESFDNHELNFLKLLLSGEMHNFWVSVFSQISTAIDFKEFVIVNKNCLQVLYQFCNVDVLLSLTGDKFLPSNLKNIVPDDMVELNSRLLNFKKYCQIGLTIEDSLSITFYNEAIDLDKIIFVLKNKYIKQYINKYGLDNQFIIRNWPIVEFLYAFLNENNINKHIYIPPSYLIVLYENNFLTDLLKSKDSLAIIWLFFCSKNTLRSISQIIELLRKGFLDRDMSFKDLHWNKQKKIWQQRFWFCLLLHEINNEELILRLLSSHYFSDSVNSLEFIAIHGGAFFVKVMNEIDRRNSHDSVEHSIKDVLLNLQTWYKKPWLSQLTNKDPFHDLFSSLELRDIETLIEETPKLFNFLLSNIRLHKKIFSLAIEPKFESYVSLLMMFSEFKSEGHHEQIILFIKQFSYKASLQFFQENKEQFINLICLPKWEFINLVTSHHSINSLKASSPKRKSEETINQSLSKRQKTMPFFDNEIESNLGLEIDETRNLNVPSSTCGKG